MKDNYDFRTDLFWLSTGTQVAVLTLAIVFTAVGFFQLPKLSLSLHKPLHLDVLLSNFTTYGVYIYAVFGKSLSSPYSIACPNLISYDQPFIFVNVHSSFIDYIFLSLYSMVYSQNVDGGNLTPSLCKLPSLIGFEFRRLILMIDDRVTMV